MYLESGYTSNTQDDLDFLNDFNFGDDLNALYESEFVNNGYIGEPNELGESLSWILLLRVRFLLSRCRTSRENGTRLDPKNSDTCCTLEAQSKVGTNLEHERCTQMHVSSSASSQNTIILA